MAGGQPLSREDRAILDLESPTIVGHTMKVVRIGAGAPDIDALRETVERRLAGAPELMMRLGGTSAEPAWVPDDNLDIAEHVGEPATPSPHDEGSLRSALGGVFAERLDRSRPLWRLDRFAMRDGGAALAWRVHHALADGMTVMRLVRATLFDDARQRPRSRAKIAPEMPHRHHLARVIERELRRSHDASPFDGDVGHDREIAFATAPLGALHDAAKKLAGATVNDAVLASVAGGIRSWLEGRHGSLGDIRVKIPVSLHHPGDAAGNRDSFFIVPLPLGEPDPLARLRAIQADTEKRKAEHDAAGLDELMGTLGAVSSRLARFVDHVERSPRRFALNVSNVPGPKESATVLGAPVEGLFSIAEIGERHAVRVAVLSYAGALCFGLCADPEIVPNVDELAAAIATAAVELQELA